MRSLVLVLATFLAAGCATSTWQTARDDARDAPLHAQAELVLVTGDVAGAANLAEAALAKAKPGSSEEARAFFALLVASDALGAVERPLPYLARVLSQTQDPEVAARVASEAERAWGRLDGQNAASPDVRAALMRVAAMPGAAWEEARTRALRQLITAERLRAGPPAARVAAAQAGFVLAWRISAPWGDAPLVDFERELGPERRALAERERTGAGWDLIPVATTAQVFSDGEVTFFDLPASGGVGFAQADVAGSGRIRLRLETNRYVQVYVDGAVVAARRHASDPWQVVADVAVGEASRITVKLASADGRGFFRLQVTPAEGPLPRVTERKVATGDAHAAVMALLDLEERLSRPRWDPDGARARVAALERSFGPHTSLDRLAARLALGDVAAPAAERRRVARARYEAVLARMPGHPAARRGLARIERDEERPDRALALLLDGERDVRTELDLLDLYRERGWEVEALASAEVLAPAASGSPRLMQELIDLYKAFGRNDRALALARELEAGFPGAGVERVYGLEADRDEVHPEGLNALWNQEPQRQSLLRTAIAGLRRLGREPAAIDQELTAFLAARPQDGWALGERVRVALDVPAEALGRIREALDNIPDFAPMEALAHQIEGTPEVFDVLEDGRAILGRWKAFAATDAGRVWAGSPVVNVLERTRVEVRKDGSTVELSHRLRLVQTKQGVDQLGDVRPPDGVRLLVARTLKADGRVLEPERTPGKAELSFPELEPGDAVETAWVSRSRVAPSEGGYLTGVSFASWGTPIFELDAQFRVAPGLRLAMTRFGGAPEPRVSEDGTELGWKLERLAPIAKEPMSVSARSFFPFADLRVVAAAEREGEAFNRIVAAYVARIAYLSEPGPRVAELAQKMRKQRVASDAAFDWVKSEIADQEQLNTFETPVEAAIANRKGNRALVLWALLRALAVDTDLLLCAPERDGPPEDRATPTPNPNRFFYPVVVGAGRYFDPARPYTPPGDLPPELAKAACVSLSHDTARFVSLPVHTGGPTFEARVALVLDADGNATGTIHGLARGAAASPLRQAYLAQDEQRQRILFEQWLASLAVGARLIDYKVDDVAAPADPMRWKLDVELPNYAVREGDALIIRRPLKPLMHADFAGASDLAQLVSVAARTTPLRLLPFSERVELTIKAPGMKLQPPPEIDLPMLSQTSKVERDSITILRTVDLRPGRVSPPDYARFRADVGAAIRGFEAEIRASK